MDGTSVCVDRVDRILNVVPYISDKRSVTLSARGTKLSPSISNTAIAMFEQVINHSAGINKSIDIVSAYGLQISLSLPVGLCP